MEEMAKRKYEIAYNLMWPNRIVMRIEDRCLGGERFQPGCSLHHFVLLPFLRLRFNEPADSLILQLCGGAIVPEKLVHRPVEARASSRLSIRFQYKTIQDP